jgi:hypothetical protein
MIDLEKALPIIDPSSAPRSGIADLISDILTLKEKLDHPQEQSEYFRWGLDSSKMRLKQLIAQYTSMKDEYNSLTLDDMITLHATEKEKLHIVMSTSYPIFIKIILRNSAQNRIHFLSEFLRIRSTVDQLPEVIELERNKNMLAQVFDSVE